MEFWVFGDNLVARHTISSVTQSCPTLCDPMDSSTPGFPVHHQLLELTQLVSIESVMPSNHLSLYCPLLLLPSIVPSIRVFCNELFISGGQSIRASASSEYSGLISFRIDLFDLLAVQGTLKSLLQNHSSKASVLWCSAFLIVQLSHPYMTTGKTIALTRWNFVGKLMSLLLNMLYRLVKDFLARGKRLLTSQLQSPSAVILEARKIKSATVSPSVDMK